MSHKKNEFQPPWSDEAPEAGSYRSVFKKDSSIPTGNSTVT